MAVVFAQAAAQTRLTDLGELLAGGTVELQTSGNAEVATLGLASEGAPASAFHDITGKVGTFGNMTPDSSATGGVVAKAVFKTSGGTTIMTLSVSAPAGGGDIILPSTTIAAGAIVDMSDTIPITFTEP